MVKVTPTKFSTAADAFDAVSQQALDYAIAARGTLSGYGGMAGTDPGGESFSEAYDQMAAAALQTLYDIAVASRGLDRALTASGGTHAQANGNAEGIAYDASGAFVLRPEIPETSVSPPPSAFGGRPDTMVQGLDSAAMWVWDQVLNFIGTLFPDGDPEKLEEAGRAWSGILGDIQGLRTDIRLADNALIGMESGELASIETKVNDFADGLTTFLSTDEGIGAIDDICKEYAQTIRETLEETRQMIAQLVIEVIAGAGISFALSFVTFGAAGVVGGGAIAARIAVVAGRIASLVSKCVGTASRLAIRLRAIVAGMRAAGAAFPKLTRVGIELVSGTASTVLAESVQGGDANYLAAFTSGLAGGSITSAITAPFGKAGERFLVRALSNGAGGAGGTVVDSGVRGEDITPGSIAMGAGLGVAMSARLPGRRGPGASSSSGGGSGVDVDASGIPTGAGNAANSSSVDGAAPRAEFDGPSGQGGDVSSSGGDGGGAQSNHGEAPAEQEIVVTPENSGSSNDGPGADGPVNDGPVKDGPVNDGPVNDGPVNDGPVNDGPQQTAPGNDGPGGDGTANDGPGQSGTADDAPSNSTPEQSAGDDGAASDGSQQNGPDGSDGSANGGSGTNTGAGAVEPPAGAGGSGSDGGTSSSEPGGLLPDTAAPDGSTEIRVDEPVADGTGDGADAGDGADTTGDADADAATPPADPAAGAASPNPRVQTLVDADGNTLSFKDWDAAHNADSDVPLNHRKGEFGELHAQAYMEAQGWTRIDDGADGSHATNANGVDGIYSRTDADGNTEFAVIEAKYNTARLGDTLDGRQMSRPWIRARLDAALGDVSPELRADVRTALRRGDLDAGVVRVMPNGDVTVRQLDNSGYVVRDTGAHFATADGPQSPASPDASSPQNRDTPGAEAPLTAETHVDGAEATADPVDGSSEAPLSDADAVNDSVQDPETTGNGGDSGDDVGGQGGTPPGREYTLADGSTYETRWAPEQLDGLSSAYDELAAALPEGRTMDDLARLIDVPTEALSPADRAFLHDMRMAVHYDGDTVFQKVLPPGEDFARLNGTYAYDDDSVAGFVTRLQDVLHFHDSEAVYAGLRLDYPGTTFNNPFDEPIHAQMIRYQHEDDVALNVPFDAVMQPGSSFNGGYPFTGNGMTASGLPVSDGNVVPEFKEPGASQMRPGAEMWEVTPNGIYRLLGVLDRNGSWQAVANVSPASR
ncbi:hypothetical protein OED01_13890 [Microbacterium sp. M28]|uniref:WXG100-like domain-containing protein n=1 Tax=Microbacterium sp. M28 TaxID=2962064 RepID=UPI0021F45CB0|nr:hypothetical protein [Microbacterium sp. M28]UYO96680.1 hypothetical protein OED01_13890 [Microbacterium sp. M28]